MNEISYVAGISGALAPYTTAMGTVFSWGCRRKGYLRDVSAGSTFMDLITLLEFNVVHKGDVTHRLVDSVEHKIADGAAYPSKWSGGVNLACFIDIINDHGTDIWMDQDDIIQVRVASRSSEPMQFDLGLVFFTNDIATNPRLWWARIEDGALTQPLKPNDDAVIGTRRGDHVVVNPYTYVGFDKKSK